MVLCGNKEIDGFIEEQNDKICLIYGPSASGKTTLALMFAVDAAKKGKKVIFLDTEDSFSVERLKQMEKGDKFLENIFLLRALDFDEQSAQMKKIRDVFNEKISLVVIDTLSMHYRLDLKRDPFKANKRLMYQLDILKKISEKIPVIVTNQVYNKPGTDEFRMIGGKMVHDYGEKIISLEKEPERKLSIVKPFSKSCVFGICDSGFRL